MKYNAEPWWLSPSGVSRLGAAWFGLYLVIGLGYLGFSSLWQTGGYVIVSDLSVFWTAAQLAAQGHASWAYQEPLLHATLAATVPSVKGNFGWFYPPSFYLLVLPLAYFPHYFPAYLAWELPSLGIFLAVWRSWAIPRGASGWMLAGFGALWLNLLRGQNGFLTAAIFGLALRTLVRGSPWAGVWVGLLCFKPQLALVPCVMLLVSRNGRAMLLAALTVLLTNGLAVMLLGPGVWQGWWQSMGLARHYLEQDGLGSQYWLNMPTVFAQIRLWGGTVTQAYVAQGVSGLAALGGLLLLWSRCADTTTRMMAVTIVSMMVSPYLMDYDLIWLIWFLVLALERGQKEGWRKGEAVVWTALWLMPVLGRWWVGQFGFQWAPWLLWGEWVMLGWPLFAVKKEIHED